MSLPAHIKLRARRRRLGHRSRGPLVEKEHALAKSGAHLAIVFAALVVTHWIEHQTGWSIKKFVRTARRYRTIQIRAGQQILTAAHPLPEDLREALAAINPSDGVHEIEPTRGWPGCGVGVRRAAPTNDPRYGRSGLTRSKMFGKPRA